MKKIKNYIKENKITTIILIILILLFTIFSYLVFNDKIINIDTSLHSFVLNIRNNNLTPIFLFITNLADAIFLIIVSVILLIIIKKKKIPVYIIINLTCSFLTNEIAKNIFVRSRPIGINLIDETGLSYPSGHSMVSLAYYGFIAYLLYINTKNKIIKTAIVLITSLIALSIGFSRIYLGVHYSSDVIGGFLLASIYLIIYIKCIKLEKK